MKVLAEVNALVVGLELLNFSDSLPIEAQKVDKGIEAISSLKNKEYDVVVSKWNLADMADGKFIKGLRLIKTHLPIIAVIDAANYMQEISARSAGVKAVVSTESLFLVDKLIADLFKLPVLQKVAADNTY
jgi:CheY-like chemotaxis protein